MPRAHTTHILPDSLSFRSPCGAQMLDNLAVERERGITIKAQTVSLLHRDAASGELFLLNLIDTPGHVDFSYEVSRSIAACQGALLLVDATKGVQAQTVANFFLAFEQVQRSAAHSRLRHLRREHAHF